MRFRGITALAGALVAFAIAAGGASAEPFHILVGGHTAQPPTLVVLRGRTDGIECYGPPQIEQAYDMQPLYGAGLTGAGKTIVHRRFVRVSDHPERSAERSTRRTTCRRRRSFDIITPDGAVTQNDPTDVQGWGESRRRSTSSIRTRWRPGANILLVETPVAETEGIVGIPQMVEAENYVIDHHLGDVITQSCGATEQTFTSPQQLLGQRSAYLNALAHNVSVLASSGDTGAANYEFDGSDLYPFPTVGWPASDPLVTARRWAAAAPQQERVPYSSRTTSGTIRRRLRGTAVRGERRTVVGVRPAVLPGRRCPVVVGRDRRGPGRQPERGGLIRRQHLDELRWPHTPGFYQIAGTSEASPLFSGNRGRRRPGGTPRPRVAQPAALRARRRPVLAVRRRHAGQQHGHVDPAEHRPDDHGARATTRRRATTWPAGSETPTGRGSWRRSRASASAEHQLRENSPPGPALRRRASHTRHDGPAG